MTTQFDDVVKDAKRSAKQEIAEYLKRQMDHPRLSTN
jgi:hypothetical protein